MTSFTTTTSTSNTSHSTITTSTTNKTSSSSSSSRLSSSSQPTVNSACAACKYQRRKCKPDCTLAPFFPASDQQKFLNAHRLFGVSNINKIINNLDPMQRTEAMHTIIFQSDMRAQYPVGGCYHYIRDLERQFDQYTAELAFVLHQLEIFRAQAAAVAQPISPAGGMSAMAPPDMDQVNPNLLLNTPTADDAGNVIYDGNLFPSAMNPNSSLSQPQHDQQQFYNYFCYDSSAAAMSRDQNNNVPSSNSMLSQQHPQQQHPHCGVDDVDVKPLVELFECRTSLTSPGHDEGDSKNNSTICQFGTHHRSTSLEFRDEPNQVEHMPEHDLKGAASLFTLTNCSSSSL